MGDEIFEFTLLVPVMTCCWFSKLSCSEVLSSRSILLWLRYPCCMHMTVQTLRIGAYNMISVSLCALIISVNGRLTIDHTTDNWYKGHVFKCLFSHTSQKAQLRAPLSPLQTAWTSFNPILYSGGSLVQAVCRERVELLIEFLKDYMSKNWQHILVSKGLIEYCMGLLELKQDECVLGSWLAARSL